MNKIVITFVACGLASGPAIQAGSIAHTLDGGGQRATSANYTMDSSLGGVGGVSSNNETTSRIGYIGQLTETTSLTVTATPTTVNETTTTQLSGTALMDDDTVTALTGSEIAWTAPTWPLDGITAGGIATAAAVYANTPATLNGSYLGVAGSGSLQVLDTLADNYGSYTGDGLDDSWQNQYFGLNNPDAGPLADPDGDSQNNAFEFTAGLVPTDALSRFLLHVEPVAGEPAQKRIVLNPRLNGRTYTLLFSTNLLPNSWQGLTNTNVSDNGTERTITDLDTSQRTKFYRIQITAP